MSTGIKNCKTRKQLEAYFKKPFHEIVAEHLKSGWSRYLCADILQDLTGNTITIGTSTLWNCVKQDIDLGLIKNFDFKGRTKGNKRYRVRHLRKNQIQTNSVAIEVTYICTQCNHAHTQQKELTPPFEILKLRGLTCPVCNSMGTTKAEFDFKGIHAIKAVIRNKRLGAVGESFVTTEMEEITNPFEPVAV